jgi:hypothetical protein
LERLLGEDEKARVSSGLHRGGPHGGPKNKCPKAGRSAEDSRATIVNAPVRQRPLCGLLTLTVQIQLGFALHPQSLELDHRRIHQPCLLVP